jgi:uncharacterized lipoprotein YddW (UPF0748 family)
MKRTPTVTAILLGCALAATLAALAHGPARAQAAPPPASAPAPGADTTGAGAASSGEAAWTGPVDYLWVVRTALLSRAEVDSVVARARSMGVRGLLVQVVGRGDAFYRSDLLPRPEALADPGFDPLGALLPAAHAAGLEVHAWMNCTLVWSAPQPPRSERHVVRVHPEWIARLRDGRRLDRLTARQRQRLGVEGVFLTPAHPGVRAWIAGAARELVSRYPVDGLHLDYIRQPDAAVGFDATTRARFALDHGVDPARREQLPWTERARLDSLWLAFQRDQVTALVREVRDSVATVRPGLTMSAAVIADTVQAHGRLAQAWSEWLRTGLVDRVFVMCYAPEIQRVLDQLVGFAAIHGLDGSVVPGIAVYNAPAAGAAARLKAARALGFPRVALYSYDSLFAQPGYWHALRGQLEPPAGGR